MTEVTIEEKNDFEIKSEGGVTSPKGFHSGGLHCGIKHKRPDFGWLISDIPASAAAVYTTNQFQAAPLIVTKESLAVEQKLQAVVVNSGVANACTGEQGLNNAYQMREWFAAENGLEAHHIAVVSTGVIGDQLPMKNIQNGIKQMKTGASHTFEQAILTTDTCTKQIAVQMMIDGQMITIGGAAKGSGMIHPNMATMLAFITTDAMVSQPDLQSALKHVTDQTFNRITVDGDTSTNDMVLVMANGLAGIDPLTKDHPQWHVFLNGFQFVAETLAKMIARDGEGATKLIEVVVKGAIDEAEAEKMSKAIVGSNLVKTAMFGADANWGRIVCALGYSGGELKQPEKLSITLGDISVVKNGLPIAFDETKAKAYLEQDNILINIDLGDGDGAANAWGCDLTYDYVRINASYRT
ncbi:bifunctional ornithine acetyltransferase/N-acetylglutamate synthase [Camelliibacillus cellulosilyticus]|uniref:Arginine biosynthesis bifunctional protein ArgJ n=1 Tax=Camelliibacillus cellulosilyticus TaxID=2174486 RepID=A0ABV9GKJ4_9BACL